MPIYFIQNLDWVKSLIHVSPPVAGNDFLNSLTVIYRKSVEIGGSCHLHVTGWQKMEDNGFLRNSVLVTGFMSSVIHLSMMSLMFMT